jgi:hypothetical protein
MTTAGTVRIEWVGEKSPLDDEYVWFAKHTGRYTPRQLAVLEAAALTCVYRTKTAARELLAGNGDGQLPFTDAPLLQAASYGYNQQGERYLSRPERRGYIWGAGNRWVMPMSFHDADVLLSSRDGHEFVNLDARELDEPKLIVPPQEVLVVHRQLLDRFGELRSA